MLRLLASLLLGLAICAVIACADDEDEAGLEADQDSSPSPSQGVSSTPPSTIPSPTVVVSPTPLPTSSSPTPTTDPATWPTYHDPSGLFAIRYPTGWFEREGDFYSKNPDTFTGPPDLPAGVVKLEITHAPDDQLSGCGPLERDLETGDLVPTQPASPTDVIGVPGWREINQSPEYGRLTRIDSIATIYEGECWLLAGYSTEALPNEMIFEDIAKTFKFAFGPAADS